MKEFDNIDIGSKMRRDGSIRKPKESQTKEKMRSAKCVIKSQRQVLDVKGNKLIL